MKIYSDKKYQKNFVCLMMIPFWGKKDDKFSPDNSRFDEYIKECKNIFTLSDLETADAVVFPNDPFGNDFSEFQNVTSPKKMIVFYNNDSDVKLNYRENTYVFRTSFYKSTQRSTEFAIPGWSADIGMLPIREWVDKPTVSFCGSFDRNNVRASSMEILEKSSNISTNFIKRNTFWAGALSTNSNVSPFKLDDSPFKVRQEFTNNIKNGDYSLCARGEGNFSYRIYEAMSYGRIPVFINTDCVLPYDFIVDWKEIFPIIDISEINNLPEILLQFHMSVKDSFKERQLLIRRMYEEYISPVGFFKNLNKHFKGTE